MVDKLGEPVDYECSRKIDSETECHRYAGQQSSDVKVCPPQSDAQKYKHTNLCHMKATQFEPPTIKRLGWAKEGVLIHWMPRPSTVVIHLDPNGGARSWGLSHPRNPYCCVQVFFVLVCSLCKIGTASAVSKAEGRWGSRSSTRPSCRSSLRHYLPSPVELGCSWRCRFRTPKVGARAGWGLSDLPMLAVFCLPLFCGFGCWALLLLLRCCCCHCCWSDRDAS